jgi:K(+)-stimulated pyrophosphate-energized sodium pump
MSGDTPPRFIGRDRESRERRRFGSPANLHHIAHRLRPHEDRLRSGGRRPPRRHRRRRQRATGGPTADGFETYGVTGVALITFIILAVPNPVTQIMLLVWIFVMRIGMIITSALSYYITGMIAKARFSEAKKFNFETPLTTLVWLTSFISIAMTYLLSYLLVPSLQGDSTLWWKLSTIITCGTIAGALIPELVKVFTSVNSGHVREILTASREGGAS